MKFLKFSLKPDDVVIIYVIFLLFYNLINVATYVLFGIISGDMIEGLFYASFLSALLSIASFLIISRLAKRMIIRWYYFLIIAMILLETFTFILLGRSFLYIFISNLLLNNTNPVGAFLVLNNHLAIVCATLLRITFTTKKID